MVKLAKELGRRPFEGKGVANISIKIWGGGAALPPVPTALSVVAMKTFAPLKIADDPTRPGV